MFRIYVDITNIFKLLQSFLQCHFKKTLSPFEEPKINKSVFQSELEVLPCFEMNYKLLERHKKPLSLATTRNRENPLNTAQKMASKSSTEQDEEATTEEVPWSIVTYTEEEINTLNRDVKLSVLLLSFNFATKEVKSLKTNVKTSTRYK